MSTSRDPAPRCPAAHAPGSRTAALFRLVRGTPLSVTEAWRRLTDWPAHAARVPLTRIAVLTPGPPRAGTRFTARTGAGPFGFDDPMEVVRWEPPPPPGRGASPGSGREAAGRCRVEKRGRVITGWAEIAVCGTAAGTRVTWTEELRIRGLPRACDPLVAWAGRLVFGRVLNGLLSAGSREGTGNTPAGRTG